MVEVVAEEAVVAVAVGEAVAEVGVGVGDHHQIGHTMIWDRSRRGTGIHFLHY